MITPKPNWKKYPNIMAAALYHARKKRRDGILAGENYLLDEADATITNESGTAINLE